MWVCVRAKHRLPPRARALSSALSAHISLWFVSDGALARILLGDGCCVPKRLCVFRPNEYIRGVIVEYSDHDGYKVVYRTEVRTLAPSASWS